MRRVDTRGQDSRVRGSQRVAHLDRLKIALTGGVIVAHAAMSYGAEGTWIYEEDSLSRPTGTALSALVGGGVMFVLGLFFLIAGMLTTGPLQRRGPRPFLLSRVGRLGLPVIAYALVVWPVLQWWIDRVRGQGSSLWAFYRLEFSAENWASRGTGPMWFVEILLVVTLGWCLWRWWVPARSTALTPRTAVLVAAGAIAVTTFIVRSRFGIDSAQFLDIHVWLWPQCFTLFVLGAVGAERGWLSPVPAAVLRLSRWGVGGAVLLLVGAVFLSNGPEAFKGGWHWEAACLAACEGVISVGISLLVLDWSRRHVVVHGRWERGLASAAYGAFLAQGPVLVAVALSLRTLDVAGDAKFLLLATLGVVGSFVAGGLTTTRPTGGAHVPPPPGYRPPDTQRGPALRPDPPDEPDRPDQEVSAMPQRAWSKKRERQYDHVKEGLQAQGRSEDEAEEIAARTVNKERARAGESSTASQESLDDISSGRRGGLRSHRGAGGRTRDQLYAEARRKHIKGRSKMTKAELERAVGR